MLPALDDKKSLVRTTDAAVVASVVVDFSRPSEESEVDEYMVPIAVRRASSEGGTNDKGDGEGVERVCRERLGAICSIEHCGSLCACSAASDNADKPTAHTWRPVQTHSSAGTVPSECKAPTVHFVDASAWYVQQQCARLRPANA